MNVGWLPRFCDVFCMIVRVPSSKSWMTFCTKKLSRHHGVKHCSKSFPNRTVLASQLIFNPLQTYAYCTKALFIWCLVGLGRRWSNTSLRNSMDSGVVGRLKNLCWQQTWSLTKLCWQMFVCGSWALTRAKRSIELVSTHNGKAYSDVGFHITWCGHCVWFTGHRQAKSSLNRMPAENLTSKLACGKVALSAPRTLFICIGSCMEKLARRIARWWFGPRRRQYPTVGFTICWWHIAVCYTFQWSSPMVTCLKESVWHKMFPKLRFQQRKRSQAKQWQLKTVLKCKFWMRLRPTNGLNACYQHWRLATKKLTWISVWRLPQKFSMRTTAFCVTKMFPRTLGGDFGGPVFFFGQRKVYKSELQKLDVHGPMAANFYVKSWGNQEALTGLNRGTPFCTSGINASRNKCNWTVSNFGQTAIKSRHAKGAKTHVDSIWSNAWRRAIHQPASVRSAHATLRLNLARFPLNVGRDPCLGPALYHGHLPRNYGEKTGVEKKIRDRLIALGCIKCVVVDFVGKAVWQALVVFFFSAAPFCWRESVVDDSEKMQSLSPKQ